MEYFKECRRCKGTNFKFETYDYTVVCICNFCMKKEHFKDSCELKGIFDSVLEVQE